MEAHSLAIRIIRDLGIIFKRDDNIVEFDIIPVENQLYNRSPVILDDHRIGLESWCVKHVYRYASEKLMASRMSSAKREKELVHEWSRVVLLVNPDFGSAWNMRKELVEEGYLSATQELKFSEVVLTRKPKSPDNFSHREWLLRFIVKSNPSEAVIQQLVGNELRVSLETAGRYQRNYYAWSHRIWVLNHLTNNCLDVLKYELHITKHWVECHISDYSGFHYRQYLLSLMFEKRSNRSENREEHSQKDGDGEEEEEEKREEQLYCQLQEELDLVEGSFNLYPDQEALFYHRRFILKQLEAHFPLKSKQLQAKEILFIEKNLSRGYSSSISSQWQFEMVRRHTKWVTKVLKWELDPEK